MSQANSLLPQFFHPPFVFLELTQHILESKLYPDETDIFSNWQKSHSSLEVLGPIGWPSHGPGFHPQYKLECYSGR